MKFEMPKADRARLEQLLEYLGDRADDFKKCFDVESEWCWKYADLMLRGLDKREMEYAERHHVVPISFYGAKRGSKVADDNNVVVLTYGEHLYAHYCAFRCGVDVMQGKMARAFLTMYFVGVKRIGTEIPSEIDVLDIIPERELSRIRGMEPRCKKLDEEGRTHWYENPRQHYKDYREANKEAISKRYRKYYESHRDELIKKSKEYREAHIEEYKQRKSEYHYAHRDELNRRRKERRLAHLEESKSTAKAYYYSHRDELLKKTKEYNEKNRETIKIKKHEYRLAHLDEIRERDRKYCAEHREEAKERASKWYEQNRERALNNARQRRIEHRDELREKNRIYLERKKAEGYRRRKDPNTGKQVWVFVGTPVTENAA